MSVASPIRRSAASVGATEASAVSVASSAKRKRRNGERGMGFPRRLLRRLIKDSKRDETLSRRGLRHQQSYPFVSWSTRAPSAALTTTCAAKSGRAGIAGGIEVVIFSKE